MSGKLALILGVTAVAFTWIYTGSDLGSLNRTSKKAKILQGSHDHERRTAKPSGPLTVRMENEGEAPSGVGDVYKVVGIVSSSQAVGDVELSWIVSRSAEVVSGQLQQMINMQPDQEVRIELTLKAKTAGAQRVQLRASATQTGIRFAASGHYTNKPSPRDFTNKRDLLNPQADGEEQTDQKIFQ